MHPSPPPQASPARSVTVGGPAHAGKANEALRVAAAAGAILEPERGQLSRRLAEGKVAGVVISPRPQRSLESHLVRGSRLAQEFFADRSATTWNGGCEKLMREALVGMSASLRSFQGVVLQGELESSQSFLRLGCAFSGR
jgi:hypothetical protein